MNWMRHISIYFFLSALIIIPGIYSLARYGVKPSIEFTGGSRFTLISVKSPADTILQSFKEYAPILESFDDTGLTIKSKEISQETGQPIYQGIELLPDSPWSARVREVQDGHPNFGSIYYKDGKDNPYLFQPLGSMAVGYMGKVFSLDINNTLLLSRFVLTFVAFFLIYGF